MLIFSLSFSRFLITIFVFRPSSGKSPLPSILIGADLEQQAWEINPTGHA